MTACVGWLGNKLVKAVSSAYIVELSSSSRGLFRVFKPSGVVHIYIANDDHVVEVFRETVEFLVDLACDVPSGAITGRVGPTLGLTPSTRWAGTSVIALTLL